MHNEVAVFIIYKKLPFKQQKINQIRNIRKKRMVIK